MPGEVDCEAGWNKGQAVGRDLEFTLTITVDDLDRFIRDADHVARAEGVIRSSHYGGTCQVSQGKFNLFTQGADNIKHMNYELPFKTASGEHFTLKGIKDIHDDPGMDLWPDTTTLKTKILDADGQEVLGAGILHISIPQFLRQLMTFEAVGTSSTVQSMKLLTRFGAVFMGGLWDAYGVHYFSKRT